MGVAQILFVVVNLAIPGWLYFRTADGDDPSLALERFEHEIEKIVEATGPFGPCSAEDLAKTFRELCEQSLDRWSEKGSVIVERAAPAILFSCEIGQKSTVVQWRVENAGRHDLNCVAPAKVTADQRAPAFVFNHDGKLAAIEFSARNGQRQTVKVANCRRKLQLTLNREHQRSGQAIVDRMPRLKSDPRDFVIANRICYDFDVAREWAAVRTQVETGDSP